MLPLTRSRNRARFFGTPFSPEALFVGGTVAGAWYDPSDLSTLFTTSDGTTPVAMPGLGSAVSVGLMLDKSQGATPGSELVTNGDFSSGTAGWALLNPGSWSVSSGVATINAATTGSTLQQIIASVVVGRWYAVSYDIVSVATNTLRIDVLGSGANWFFYSPGASGRKTVYVVAQNTEFAVACYGNTVASIDNISVRELPGNHAISFNNTTARPELRARVNLLTYSEQFDNGAWVKLNINAFGSGSIANTTATFDPLGGNTADYIQENTSNAFHGVFSGATVGANVTVSFSAYLKAAQRTWAMVLLESTTGSPAIVWFNLQNGTVGTQQAGVTGSIAPAGNGWYKCTVVGSRTTTDYRAVIGIANADNSSGYLGDGTSGIYIWGADLRVTNIGANVPAYQRIADANTYDTSGFPLYLRFDGVDDSMYTPANLNLSGTDKVAVFAGVRKLSDAATGIVAELSVEWNSNSGSFAFGAPSNTGITANYSAASKGNAAFNINQVAFSAVALAPISNVYAATHDIPGDLSAIRLNGAASGTNGTGDKGAGNFGTYPLFIGARNNSSIWFNGHLYSLAVVGSTVSAGNIAAMESWVAGRTGIQI